MSFNIRGSDYDDGKNRWEHRADLNVRTIRRYDPDLIGFQELQTGNIRTYRRELPGYGYLAGPRYNNEPPFNYPSNFWKLSRFAWRESGGFFLSPSGEPEPAWDANLIRSAAWVRLRDRRTGAVFVHLNTHLDHQGERARVGGSEIIVGRLHALQSGGVPALVTGDFNCNPGSTSHRTFLDAGFVDTWLAAGNADGPGANTFHGFTGQEFTPREGTSRIDWILARDGAQGFETHSNTIIRDAEPPLYPSDHYPILAEISFGHGGKSHQDKPVLGRQS